MTITFELTEQQEARLRVLAAAAGQTVEDYAVALIMRHLDELEAAADWKQKGRKPNDTHTQPGN